MKKFHSILALTLTLLLGNILNTNAQAPEGITYQAEARDASGKLLTNKALTVETTLLKGSSSGYIEWQKQYFVTTDNYGLFTIVIGEMDGIPATKGDFSAIDWGTGTYFLNVKILWSKKWLDMGTTQLLSVPYALYAKSAGSANITETDPVYSGSSWYSTDNNSSNWNTAYTWGDHAGLYRPIDWIPAWNDVLGKLFRINDSPLNGDLLLYDAGIGRFINWTPNYLTSYTESDPLFSASPSFGIGNADINNWKTAYSWGNHAVAGYLKNETDPVVKGVIGLVKSNGTTIAAAVSGTDYLAPGQAVTSVTGTAPIVSTGGTAPVITINPATTSNSGSMSAADKAKLDGIATGAELNVNADWTATEGDGMILNKPDLTLYATKNMENQNITDLADPVNARDAATKAYVDALQAEVNNLKLKVELLRGDKTIGDLLAAGKTVKELLDAGLTPEEFVGTYYQGGVIFYVNPEGWGLVCAVTEQSLNAPWGCFGTTTNAKNYSIGGGEANTVQIELICTAQGTAADICANLELNGYSDWFLPNRIELSEMCKYKEIITDTSVAQGGTPFSGVYWSSIEAHFSAGIKLDTNGCNYGPDSKDYGHLVRAVRSF